MSTGSEIQNDICLRLSQLLGSDIIVREWSIRRKAIDTFSATDSYAPRLDIAVGPFNPTFEQRVEDAEAILQTDHAVLRSVRAAVAQQNTNLFQNINPRCLIGIEVEHSTSSKHILGGLANASMLGRYGVIVGSNDLIGKVRRIHAYVKKLREVEKAPAHLFGNVACLSHAEFIAIINGQG